MVRRGSLFVTTILILLLVVLATTAFLQHKKAVGIDQADARMDRSLQQTKTTAGNDWEFLFFNALEERTKLVHLPSLRPATPTDDDLEVRFWYDVLPDNIEGFVIRRSDKKWSAVAIRQVSKRWPSQVKLEVLGSPRSGWDTLWKQLSDAGLLVLPDGRETECAKGGLDGYGIVVETIARRQYRTYRYSNPSIATCDEAKRLISIENIMFTEFNLSSPSPGG